MPRLGRPREFDRDTALLRAMEIFWEHGYDGATLADLQKAMGGLAAPSFYAAFGSKEKLFREAVELYSRTLGAPMMGALDARPTAREAVENLLRAAVEAFSKPGYPRGCMLVLGAINNAPSNRAVREYLHGLRIRRQRGIERRLARAVSQGEIPARLDVRSLASFLTTVIDGLAIQARDGAPRKALRYAVDCTMSAWDQAVRDSSARGS